MNDNDMNEMFKKAQSMIQNNQIPDDIKKIINNFQNSNNQNNTPNNNQTESSMPNIDIETLMKMQNIMSKMKNSENDDMSKLLISLKPYLRDDKKNKVDEYIKLIKMGKMTQLFETFGGDKNWI